MAVAQCTPSIRFRRIPLLQPPSLKTSRCCMNFPLRYRLSGEPSETCIQAEIGTLRRSIAAFRVPISAGAEYADRSLRILGRMPDRDYVSGERVRFHKEIRDLICKEQHTEKLTRSQTLEDKRDCLIRHRANLAAVIKRYQRVFDEVAAHRFALVE
jgi:hypothetical protein